MIESSTAQTRIMSPEALSVLTARLFIDDGGGIVDEDVNAPPVTGIGAFRGDAFFSLFPAYLTRAQRASQERCARNHPLWRLRRPR